MPLPRINPLCVFVTLCEYGVPFHALTLGLGGGDNQICDSLNLRHLTTHQAEAYAGKTDKTIRRDLHYL